EGVCRRSPFFHQPNSFVNAIRFYSTVRNHNTKHNHRHNRLGWHKSLLPYIRSPFFIPVYHEEVKNFTVLLNIRSTYYLKIFFDTLRKDEHVNVNMMEVMGCDMSLF